MSFVFAKIDVIDIPKIKKTIQKSDNYAVIIIDFYIYVVESINLNCKLNWEELSVLVRALYTWSKFELTKL